MFICIYTCIQIYLVPKPQPQETNSHIFGLTQETVTAFEIVTADGNPTHQTLNLEP
jgi:hypothetical protein